MCFTWQTNDFLFEEGMQIFQWEENEFDGFWNPLEPECCVDSHSCPSPNPDLVENKICVCVEHLSWFAVFENEGYELDIKKGFNIIVYPGEVPADTTTYDLLERFGPQEKIEKLIMFSPADNKYFVTFYDAAGTPKGDEKPVNNFSAIQVYAVQPHQARVFYTSFCQETPLVVGRNEVGFNCVPEGYSAYNYLTRTEADGVVSIQRFNNETGLFETASLKNGNPVGIDFPIKEGEGFIVFVK